MSRIPRDVSAKELIKAMEIYGYIPVRQTGSHVRLSTQEPSPYHITIPNHKALRLGTLASIVADVAGHRKLAREQVIKDLFG